MVDSYCIDDIMPISAGQGYSLDFIPWQTEPTDDKVQSWVKHIDWMALQGINLPLAFVGYEQR